MTIIGLPDFQNDPHLKNEIFNLVKPTYKDPVAVIEREYQNNNHAYLLRNNTGELIAFFLTGVTYIDKISINYLGLACAEESYKNTGVILKLFIKAVEDALYSKKPKLCWLTTPSSQILKIIYTLMDSVNPSLNFEFTEHAIEIASRIRSSKGYSNNGSHPFIVRKAAALTQYSSEEIDRIKVHKKDRINSVFQRAEINEQEGDRLIVICNLPEIEKFNRWKQRLNAAAIA